MTNLNKKYQEVALPKLKEEFELSNDLAVPRIEKIVINSSVVEAISNKEVLERVKDQLATITGQRPATRKAKKSISSFKLKEKDPIGAMVTLRGKKAWYFFEKLISIVLPRMRDFRGLTPSSFDEFGNYSLGIDEQILFPEIDYSKIDKIRGLVATIVIRNSNKQKSQRLFELLGIPFKKN